MLSGSVVSSSSNAGTRVGLPAAMRSRSCSSSEEPSTASTEVCAELDRGPIGPNPPMDDESTPAPAPIQPGPSNDADSDDAGARRDGEPVSLFAIARAAARSKTSSPTMSCPSSPSSSPPKNSARIPPRRRSAPASCVAVSAAALRSSARALAWNARRISSSSRAFRLSSSSRASADISSASDGPRVPRGLAGVLHGTRRRRRSSSHRRLERRAGPRRRAREDEGPSRRGRPSRVTSSESAFRGTEKRTSSRVSSRREGDSRDRAKPPRLPPRADLQPTGSAAREERDPTPPRRRCSRRTRAAGTGGPTLRRPRRCPSRRRQTPHPPFRPRRGWKSLSPATSGAWIAQPSRRRSPRPRLVVRERLDRLDGRVHGAISRRRAADFFVWRTSGPLVGDLGPETPERSRDPRAPSRRSSRVRSLSR